MKLNLSRICLLSFLLILFITVAVNRASAQLYVASFDNNSVGEYDATTGEAINASFISIKQPQSLALSGNSLFIGSTGNGTGNNTIGKYDATTGAVINASFVSGLDIPSSMAVSGNNLYVATYNNPGVGKIGIYDLTTGAPINAALLSGLNGLYGIAVSGNDLFAAYTYGGNYTIGEFDAATGVVINPSLTPGSLYGGNFVVFGSNLFVEDTNTVSEYTLSGTLENTFPCIAYGMTLSGNNLYTTDLEGGHVSEYTTSGAVVSDPLISGVPYSVAVVVAPEPSCAVLVGLGLCFIVGWRFLSPLKRKAISTL